MSQKIAFCGTYGSLQENSQFWTSIPISLMIFYRRSSNFYSNFTMLGKLEEFFVHKNPHGMPLFLVENLKNVLIANEFFKQKKSTKFQKLFIKFFPRNSGPANSTLNYIFIQDGPRDTKISGLRAAAKSLECENAQLSKERRALEQEVKQLKRKPDPSVP